MFKIVANLTQREKPDFFGALLRNLPDVIYTRPADHNGNLCFVTENIIKITGYSSDELQSSPWIDFIVYEDKCSYLASFQQALKTASPFKCSYRIRTKNGEMRWLRDRATPVFNARAEVTAFNGILSECDPELEATRCSAQTEDFCHLQWAQATLLSNLPGIAYRCKNDENWTFEFVSQGCKTLTGYEPVDIINNNVVSYSSLIHKDDVQRVRVSIQLAVEKRELFKITYRLCTPMGKKWVHEQGQGIYNEDGTLNCLEGFITDITERKLAEMELARSEEKYRTLVESSQEIIAIVDENERIVFINSAAASFLNSTPSEIINKTLGSVLPANNADSLKDAINTSLTTQKCFIRDKEFSIKGKNFWFNTSFVPIRMPAGEPRAVLLVGHDITELKVAQERLKESQEKFKNLVETSEDIVFQIDRKATIQYVSPRITELYGWQMEDVVGHRMTVTTPAVELLRALKAIRVVLSGKRIKNFEINQKDKFGCLIPMEVNASPIILNGKIVGVQGVMRNISERKIRELELKRANEELKEHDRLKNDFLSTISHEIRTPLCIFKNVLSNAKAGVLGPLSPKLLQNVEMSEHNVNRLSHIVNDFLDVAKIDAGKMRLQLGTFNVQELINEVLESFSSVAQARGLKLSAMMQEPAIVIEADHDKIVQVLANLVGNSIKFTPSGGRIDIEVNSYGDKIAFAVKDTGKGIEKQDLEKLFDRFVQVGKILSSNEHGTGLGLAIVKELVGIHRGRVWAESKLGSGCTVTFVLPKKHPAT